jgi:hypothetical protein
MLPNDFDEVLSSAEHAGILEEDTESINDRLTLAIQTAVITSGQGDLSVKDIGDWILKTKNSLLQKVRNELCDKQKGGLREDYKELLNLGLTAEGVKAISTVIVTLIEPTLVTSTVLIFTATWLLRRGLNNWCSLPE